MAEDFNRIRELIHIYIQELEKNGLKIEKAILYGSYARGNQNEFSDIDFALISKDFTGERFDDRRKIIPLRRQIDERLEPMPFLPEDFHEGSPLAAEIMDHGIEIELEKVRKSKKVVQT